MRRWRKQVGGFSKGAFRRRGCRGRGARIERVRRHNLRVGRAYYMENEEDWQGYGGARPSRLTLAATLWAWKRSCAGVTLGRARHRGGYRISSAIFGECCGAVPCSTNAARFLLRAVERGFGARGAGPATRDGVTKAALRVRGVAAVLPGLSARRLLHRDGKRPSGRG